MTTQNKKKVIAPSSREYLMRVSGGLVKHLGLQMYSGAVPAIAELVSNAWDAMARNVWITIPLDKPLEETDQIIVKDDGHGMTFKECNDAYLVIGRDRRKAEGEYSRKFNDLRPRRLQSRKGIGKLAGFGIANRIEIRTIAKGEMSHFALDYDKIVRDQDFVSQGGYKPDPMEDDGQKTTEVSGTTVTLLNLKISRSISKDQLIKSMARRFTIMSDNFKVFVNNTLITKEEHPFQFRYPEKPGAWEAVNLPNGQSIKWWAGFTQKPISDEEARGFVVYARGKLTQTPWFFDLSGGAWGQHGLQYLTGEIIADWLDQTEGQDLIATDRGTVRWEDPLATPLKEWGIKKTKELLEQWASRRREEKVRSPRVIQFLQLSERLPDRERRIFKAFVDKVTSIPQVDVDQEGKEILDELVEFGYNAVTNRAFIDVIRQLNAASPEDRKKLEEMLSEWDILEAVNTARLVRGRVEIIRNFRSMVEAGVREKPDLQDYLKSHPWLIDPLWTMLSHEEALDTLIKNKFKMTSTKEREGKKRLDFFCLGDRYKVAYVVELKRPGETVGRKELDQLRDYVLFLRDKLQDSSTAEKYKRSEVKGLFVCYNIRKEDDQHAKSHQQSGVMDIRTWDSLLNVSEQLHAEFLEVVKERAPKDDPRMKELDALVSSGHPKTKLAASPRVKKHKSRK